jgi:Electron transfer DM13
MILPFISIYISNFQCCSILLKGFTYDGEGPATYFYMDTSAVPTANGLSLLDSVGGLAPSCGSVPIVAADGTGTYRAEFPSGKSIQDFLGGSFSVWCTTALANFGEVVIPSSLPGSVAAVDDSSLLVCASLTAPTPTNTAPVTVTVPTTPNQVPVISPTSTTAPAKSSPVAAPAPAMSTSAARHDFGFSVSLRCLVLATVMLSFLRHSFETI